MVGVCMQTRGTHSTKQWDYVLSNFELSPNHVWHRGELQNYTGKFQQCITNVDELPEVPLIIIQPQEGKYITGKISLATFEHPKNAIYFFGADHEHLTPGELGSRIPEYQVYIPVKGEMFSWVAAAVVLYDRIIKAWPTL